MYTHTVRFFCWRPGRGAFFLCCKKKRNDNQKNNVFFNVNGTAASLTHTPACAACCALSNRGGGHGIEAAPVQQASIVCIDRLFFSFFVVLPLQLPQKMQKRHRSTGEWSSGMILLSGRRGPEFDSPFTPFFFRTFRNAPPFFGDRRLLHGNHVSASVRPWQRCALALQEEGDRVEGDR